MRKQIEAEGSELILRNENGDIVIIPKNMRSKALSLIGNKKHSQMDELVSKLPKMSDYAEDGTIIPPTYEASSTSVSNNSAVDIMNAKIAKGQRELDEEHEDDI